MIAICNRCHGHGINHQETGERARKLREKAGASLRGVARDMGFSPSYLSDLEHGRRCWNTKLALDFAVAVYEVSK